MNEKGVGTRVLLIGIIALIREKFMTTRTRVSVIAVVIVRMTVE